jgi:hypothetical protein
VKRKTIVFPEVDTSHDEADPEWQGKNFERVRSGSHYRWMRPPGIYKRAWRGVRESWIRIAREYETEPRDFHNAWHYLNNHPIYWKFSQSRSDDRPPNHYSRLIHTHGISRCVDIDVVQVNPDTETIEEEEAKNTATRVWYETGQFDLLPREYEFDMRGQHQWHDWKIDGGAPTVEEAIIKLAHKIHKKYGNDRRYADKTVDKSRKEDKGEGESSNKTEFGTDS